MDWYNFLHGYKYNAEEIVFKNLGGMYVPCQSWPARFYISRELMMHGLCEVRPLTILDLLRGVVAGDVVFTYWHILSLLYKAGLLDTPGVFWRTLRERRIRYEEAEQEYAE